MKRLNLIGFAVACLIAGGVFTSCLEDEDSGLTPAEQQSAYLQVKGDYNGKMVYSKQKEDKSAYVNDTIPMSWSINTDSTIIVKQFPSTLLAANISDENIKTAMAACDPVDIKCYTGYYSLSPVGFLVNPTSPTYTLTYGGATHKVQVAFYVNNRYVYGVYTPASGLLQIQLIEAGIYVDGVYNSTLLTKAIPFKLFCTKTAN